MDNVDANVPTLDSCSYRASEAEHGVFASTVHGGGGNGHPGRLKVRTLGTTAKILGSSTPMEPITTIALRSNGDALLTSK